MREGKHTYAFFLMFRKHLTQFGMMVYGLSYGNLGLGVGCGELLRICMASHRVLFYWREKYLSNSIIGQGVAQGCSMSPILFSIFNNQLLDEVEKAGIGITVKKDVNPLASESAKWRS